MANVTNRGKILPRFPASVFTSGFTTISQSGLTYTFGADFRILGAANLTDPALVILVAQDTTTGAFGKATLADLTATSQPLNPNLTALAGLDSTAGLVEQTGAATFTKRALGVGAATSIPTRADADARYQPLDAELTAFAGLTLAADKLPYATGAAALALANFTPFSRTILDDPDAATVRATLGLVIGTNVQAYGAELAGLAALSANGHVVRTGAATYAARTITGSTGRISVTNGSGASGNPTIDWDGVQVRKNSAGSTFTRRRLNLIEGTGVTLTVADDSGNDEVDVTVAATPTGSSAPLPQATSGVGEWRSVTSSVGGNLVLPAGGTWAWMSNNYNNSSGVWSGSAAAGVAAGGTTVQTGFTNIIYTGLAWRIA